MKIPNLRAKFKPKGCKGNIHFGKIILALMLVGMMILGNVEPVKASEPLYYYDRYYLNYEYEEYTYWKNNPPVNYGPIPRDALCYVKYMYTNSGGVTLDTKTGKFTGWGETKRYDPSSNFNYTLYYVESPDTYYMIESERNEHGMQYHYHYQIKSRKKYDTTSKGNKAGTVKGTINQYPSNGPHTDGYWYVRKGLVNNNPTLSISSPSENSYFV